MADSTAIQASAPDSLTAQDRFLIERCEEAIPSGLELYRWLRRSAYEPALVSLNLKKKYQLPNQAKGFLSSVPLNGQLLSVMGTEQKIEFSRVSGPQAAEEVREFVLGEFLSRAHWNNEDGLPGGFTVEKSLYKTMQGAYGQFPPEKQAGCVDWRDLGRRYAWVLLTINIHDLVMELGTFRKRLKEALCAVAHPDFIHVQQSPAPGHPSEVSIAYPVIKFAPIPNFFGYGPGKFQIAVKEFSFLLTPEQNLQVRMRFASAPRCEKVFDFGKRIPDPIYGGAALVRSLTFGLWDSQPFHNRLDLQMLVQHCRVHQALMEGTRRIWDDWKKSQRPSGPRSTE